MQTNQVKTQYRTETSRLFIFATTLFILTSEMNVLITNVSFHDNLSYFKDTIKTKKKLKPTVGGDTSLNE